MSIDKLHSWLGIVANAGVIVGIIFLSIEISQNNLLLQSEARMNQAENAERGWQEIYLNPELAALLMKSIRGDELSDAEEFQFDVFQRAKLLGMQFQYEQLRSGSLDQINIPAWRATYNGETYLPPLFDAWERSRSTMRPEFVEFFEESIIVR